MERFSEASNSFNVDLQRGDLVYFSRRPPTRSFLRSHRLGFGTKFSRNLVATLCCWRMSLYSLQYTDLITPFAPGGSRSIRVLVVRAQKVIGFSKFAHHSVLCLYEKRPWSN